MNVVIAGNVSEVRDIKADLETSRLRVILARLYRGLLLQTKMIIKQDNPGQRAIVCSYGPGYQRKKYNIAVATQMGCRVRCKEICNVPRYKRDLTPEEICDEASLLLKTLGKGGLHPHNKLKISMVKEGEPMLNRNLPEIVETLGERFGYSLKVSTTFPESETCSRNIESLIGFAGRYNETVQLQISLGSTDAKYREALTAHPTNSFDLIKELGQEWSQKIRNARKINLSFTLYEETPCSPEDIISTLSPEHFAIRLRDALISDITPKNRNSISDRRFKRIRDRFREYGYKVIEGRPGDIEKDFNLATGQYRFIHEQ